MKHIYLDYAATTPVNERVITAMQPYFDVSFGNPSSIHRFGQEAEGALNKARGSIAKNINAQPSEIIFTSCGSESNNLALRGAVLAAQMAGKGNHLIISSVEHPAVTNTAEELALLHDTEISYLPTDQDGVVSPADVEEQLRDDTVLVSIMGANNEVGSVNPLREIGSICRRKGILFHSDAVQFAAHFPLDVEEIRVDLVSLGAHKFYGPKGVGVLYVRNGTDIRPVMTGGSQEFGLRAATQNIPLIVGMAEAFQQVQEDGLSRTEQLIPLRDQIITDVINSIPDSKLSGHPTKRLPNHASFVIKNADGNYLIQLLDASGFACSSGSACKTGDPKPSSVLTQLGYDPEWALGSLRVTLGKDTTQQDVNSFLDILPGVIEKARGEVR